MLLNNNNNIPFDPKVWGPWYWGFLHTTAMCYPDHPNAVVRKQAYTLIQNFPAFIPVESMSASFADMLVTYPVEPYLDSRKSFVKWTHFIHNQVNRQLQKPEMSFNDFVLSYHQKFLSSTLSSSSSVSNRGVWREKLLYLGLLVVLLVVLFWTYPK